MRATSLAVSRNRLLASLSEEEGALLRADLEPVGLDLRQRLEQPNRPIRHVYFPESGLGSVVALGGPDRQAESGLFGREGMSGLAVVLGGDRAPNDTFMQIGGAGRRIAVAPLREALATSPTLRLSLLRYVHVCMVQTAQTALSNARARLDERLARWLLMCRDRLDPGEMPLTHEFIALMLGVRRAGVTEALHDLKWRGLISTHRGSIEVEDRAGLMTAANGSYGLPESEYARLIG